jgi:hypothetical protein
MNMDDAHHSLKSEERSTNDTYSAVNREAILIEVPRDLLADLRQCYEESNIPYRVEVVDLFTSDPEFRHLVREEGVLWED